MAVFAQKMPEDDTSVIPEPIKENSLHRKERLYSTSEDWYQRFAWQVTSKVTTTVWFESFVMLNILLIGAATGLDLENNGRDAWCVVFTNIVGGVTSAVFTVEVVLKIMAEGREPLNYFTDEVRAPCRRPPTPAADPPVPAPAPSSTDNGANPARSVWRRGGRRTGGSTASTSSSWWQGTR